MGTRGCLIRRKTAEGAHELLKECTDDNHYGCMDRQEDDTDIHECYCENSECNLNFETAEEGGQETTSQQEETIQCYSCNGHSNDCSSDVHGQQISCLAENGCRLAEEVIEEGTFYLRGCSTEQDFTCEKVENGNPPGGTTYFCNCGTDLCNADFASAGQTQTSEGDSTPQPTNSPNTSTFKEGSIILVL